MKIGEVAELCGLSLRALRHFEDIGLLEPERDGSGYRNYQRKDVERLQEILLYRSLELPLKDIGHLLDKGDRTSRLRVHRLELQAKKEQLERLIEMIDTALEGKEMSEKDMLDPFVKRTLDDNEARYGEEVRERWGEAQYRESQEKLAKLSKEEFEALLTEGTRLYKELAACIRAGLAPENDAAQEIVEKHFAYLRNFGDFYTLEVYANLGRMYEMDARFAKTFNDIEGGLAHYFAEAIEHFCVARS